MRRLLLLLPLTLLAGCYPYYPYYGYTGAYAQGYPYPPGYYPPGPPPGSYSSPPMYRGGPAPYAGGPGPYARGQATSPENCGTPDQPKPCPPMPRVPLQYYPANRQ